MKTVDNVLAGISRCFSGVYKFLVKENDRGELVEFCMDKDRVQKMMVEHFQDCQLQVCTFGFAANNNINLRPKSKN